MYSDFSTNLGQRPEDTQHIRLSEAHSLLTPSATDKWNYIILWLKWLSTMDLEKYIPKRTAYHHRHLFPCVDLGKGPEACINPDLSTCAFPYEWHLLECLQFYY